METTKKDSLNLLERIHDAPATSKPALGPNPFSGTPIAPADEATIDQPGGSISRKKPLNTAWFLQEQARAQGLISKVNLTGSMEFRATVSQALSKSQIELLNAVKLSEIRTFGWPIGITLEN